MYANVIMPCNKFEVVDLEIPDYSYNLRPYSKGYVIYNQTSSLTKCVQNALVLVNRVGRTGRTRWSLSELSISRIFVDPSEVDEKHKKYVYKIIRPVKVINTRVNLLEMPHTEAVFWFMAYVQYLESYILPKFSSMLPREAILRKGSKLYKLRRFLHSSSDGNFPAWLEDENIIPRMYHEMFNLNHIITKAVMYYMKHEYINTLAMAKRLAQSTRGTKNQFNVFKACQSTKKSILKDPLYHQLKNFEIM